MGRRRFSILVTTLLLSVFTSAAQQNRFTFVLMAGHDTVDNAGNIVEVYLLTAQGNIRFNKGNELVIPDIDPAGILGINLVYKADTFRFFQRTELNRFFHNTIANAAKSHNSYTDPKQDSTNKIMDHFLDSLDKNSRKNTESTIDNSLLFKLQTPDYTKLFKQKQNMVFWYEDKSNDEYSSIKTDIVYGISISQTNTYKK